VAGAFPPSDVLQRAPGMTKTVAWRNGFSVQARIEIMLAGSAAFRAHRA
jgi:hypothetical protein